MYLFKTNVGHHFITFVTVDICSCVDCIYMAFTTCCNEVVHLIIKGVPKACHVELRQKTFLKSTKA